MAPGGEKRLNHATDVSARRFQSIRSKGKPMADIPRRKPPPPDGAPAKRRNDRDSTSRSRVSEVQDPEISGDVEPGPRSNSVEPAVDKAGQIVRERNSVDELH
jgi:hypothetical protein